MDDILKIIKTNSVFFYLTLDLNKNTTNILIKNISKLDKERVYLSIY